MREQKRNIWTPVMYDNLQPAERPEGFAMAKSGQQSALPIMAALRRHIARLEQRGPQLERTHSRGEPWTLGLAEIDSHLAARGLARRGLHDITPAAYGDMPVAMGFAAALALRRLADPAERRPLLWARLAREEREYGRLYGHGLESLGLARARFLTVTLKTPIALLWVMEEALKSGALALVIGDADPSHCSLTATRRLSLAAHSGKAAGLLVFSKAHTGATASDTRWQASAFASRAPPYDEHAPGRPAWMIDLTRARHGRPGRWLVEWQHATHRFALVSGLPRGALHPWTDESPPPGSARGPALRAG
jgi:protein ImuA